MVRTKAIYVHRCFVAW